METSPFNDLPAEIRNTIAHNVLVSDNLIRVYPVDSPLVEVIRFRDGDKTGTEHTKTVMFVAQHAYPFALCYTCQQLQKETLEIFLSRNTFKIMTAPPATDDATNIMSFSGLQPLDGFMGFASQRHLRQIELNIQIDIGKILFGYGNHVQSLRALLKHIADKKTENVIGACVTTFTATTGFNHLRSFTIDAWSLKSSLPTVAGGIRDFMEQQGHWSAEQVEQVRRCIAMWVKSDWAT